MSECLSIDYRSVGNLRAYPRNARTHSRKQIKQIAGSIKQFGFTNPLLIDDAGMILAGHGRLEAAKLLEMDKVPCVVLSRMTATQKRAYVLADNKLVLNGGWDDEILGSELQELISLDPDFDISLTGFSIPEIDRVMEGLHPSEKGDPAEENIPALSKIAVSKAGDLWQLGPHKLFCGSALEQDSFEILMGDERAQMMFTDPPYNVPINGNVGGLGRIRHREFAMASGEMSQREFTEFLRAVMSNLAKYSIDGSIHYHCMDWRHLQEILEAGKSEYTELKNICVWAKDAGGMGTFYRSRHELVLVFKHGTKPHINAFELGQHGRYRTNVWEYRGYSIANANDEDQFTLHPTVKPVGMIADAIKDVSCRGGPVLDCFGGSGSTLIAAHKTGRRARVIEIDPLYVDVAIRRWQEFAKDEAILAGTNQIFSDIAISRSGVPHEWA